MSKYTVVFDACVLYPAPLRDLLLRLASTTLFKAQWTDQIHDEWINALLRTGKYKPEVLQRTRILMDAYVLDAKVTGYEPLISSLSLPDPDDRHVLAAAIRFNASAIITSNLRDFPAASLGEFGIEALHPDDFIYYQLDMAPEICCKVIREQRVALKKPPLDVDTFLERLQIQQLPKTVSRLRAYRAFL